MPEQLDRMEMKLREIETKVEATSITLEKMRKYAKWTGIITIVMIVLPLFIIPLFVPAFLASQGIGGLNSLVGL